MFVLVILVHKVLEIGAGELDLDGLFGGMVQGSLR
jgi:hypothetical protein